MMHRAETMRCAACSNFIPARSRRAPAETNEEETPWKTI